MVAPVHQEELYNQLSFNKLEFRTMIQDVQQIIDEESKTLVKSTSGATFNYTLYNDFDTVSISCAFKIN